MDMYQDPSKTRESPSGSHLPAVLEWVHARAVVTTGYVEDKENALMARIIRFYIPMSYRKVQKEVAPLERGKLIVFTRVPRRKSA